MLNIWKQRWKGEKSEASNVGGPENNADVESIVTVPSTGEPSSSKRRANNEGKSSRPKKKQKVIDGGVKGQGSGYSPVELTVPYDYHIEHDDTTILPIINAIRTSGQATQRQLVLSRYVLSEIGPWAVNWVWSHIAKAYAHNCLCDENGFILYLVQKKCARQRRTLSRISQTSSALRQWASALPYPTGSAVPPEIQQDPIDSYLSDSDEEDDAILEYIEDATTGGLITPRNATSVLYSFLSRYGPAAPGYDSLFEFDEVGGGYLKGYTCRVVLPGLPINCSWSSVSTSKAYARRRASHECCLELFKAGLLDYRFFPPSQKRLRNFEKSFVIPPDALPPLGDVYSGNRTYARKAPEFWTHAAMINPTRLFPLIIRVMISHSSIPHHAPMLMLTSQPLPDLPSFKVYFSGIPVEIHLEKAATITVDDRRLQDLHMYTMRVWRNIRNRAFVCPRDKMLYFFAPLRGDEVVKKGNPTLLPDISGAISWDSIALAAQHYAVPMKFGSVDDVTLDIEDAVIQDRWAQFTRRYDVVRLRPDLSPLSPPFETEPGNPKYETLVDFCKAHRKDFNGLKDYNQVLVQVSKFPVFVDRLNPSTPAGTEHGDSVVRYFIPELCAKCTIPASTMRTALLIPCILQRIDEFLLIKELNVRLFSSTIPDTLLHAALTTRSAGLEHDYERLEMLGDAFLKYLASLHVFVSEPHRDEGYMHVARQKLVSNKTLLECALSVGLPSYIQSRPFSLRNWQPPNFHVEADVPSISSELAPAPARTVSSADTERAGSVATSVVPGPDGDPPIPGYTDAVPSESQDPNATKKKRKSKKKKVVGEQLVTYLGDKAVADVAEAIIGAAFISGGSDAALRAGKSLNLPIMSEIEEWSDFRRLAETIPWHTPAGTRQMPVEKIEQIIGHRFKRPHLLAQALTHLPKAHPEAASYSKLEFIGDAILDFMVVRHVFDRNQQLAPGALTLLKGAMVSNSALAAVSVSSGLHQYLLLESAQLEGNIQSYITTIQQKESEERANAIKEHRPIGQYWHDIEAPKILADIVEAIIGAVYISDDFSPVGAEKFFERVLKPFYDEHISLQTLAHHPTKLLLELFQSKGCHQFEIVREEEQCHVLVHDVILATAQDSNAASAARLASVLGLDALEGDPGFLRRTCNCWAQRTMKAGEKSVLTGFKEGEFELD
uniref:RNase III domain-containing protein n=1 Tax=Moniliophthora roreri TaxID=221103 RepID=A0A0W0FCG8_MONRR